MSSSEDYLDSLLDSILGGGKPAEDEKPASEETDSVENKPATGAGKAMSPDEIEEMLVSMGTLDGGDSDAEKQEPEADDMEAMIAFMNEHNASVSDQGQGDDLSLDDPDLGADALSYSSVDDLTSGEPEGAGDVSDSMNDFNLDDLSLDDLDLGEAMVSDEGPDAFSLDDLSAGVPEVETEEPSDFNLDDLSLDDLDMGEEGLSEGGFDDFSLDDLDMGEEGPSDGGLEDFSLDDLSAGEAETEEPSDFNLDDLSLDDLDLGDAEIPEGGLDDFSLDDLDLGDDGLSDGGSEDFSLDDLSADVPDLSEDTMDGSALDDLSLDDFSLDDLSVEESGEGLSDGGDDLMSEEEIDRLLGSDMSFAEEPAASEDTALGTDAEGDDDLAALLAGMDHDDDLSEIHDLLGESEQGISADDDILAMLEGAGGDGGFDLFGNNDAAREAGSNGELTPEEIAAGEGGKESKKKEKKKRKKMFGKKKGGSEEETMAEGAGTELEDLLGTASDQESASEESKEKKPGMFGRFLEFLLESDEDDEDPLAAEVLADSDGVTGNVSDENKALLEEMSEEDKKGKKKKKKDKKKGKKGKAGEGEEEEAAEGEEAEDTKKAKKRKKKKKEKKAEDSEVDLFAPPEKKLSKKKVIPVFLFSATVAACIILLSSFLPNYMEKREAHVAYDHREYDEVFDLLYGKELDEQDEILFQRSNLILQMNRKLASYENYVNLDMRLESLNALVSGVARYQEILPDAETYNVVGEVSDIYTQILERLSADFGLSESDALDILASEDDETYSRRLWDVINGAVYGEDSGGRQDVLPEEEEIIERIDGLGTEENPEEDALPEEIQEELDPVDENGDEGAE